MWAYFRIFIIVTDELPVPRFRVNSLYSPVIRVPNRVALDLEVIAANFGHPVIAVHRLRPHARRHHTPLAMPNRLTTNHSWTLWTGGCASSQWEDGTV